MAFPRNRCSTFTGSSIPMSRACRPQYARRLGMLASQYRGFFGAIRLKLALAHNVRPPPPSVFQTLVLREMASTFLATGTDHPGSSKGKRNYNRSLHVPTTVAWNSKRWRNFNAEPLQMREKPRRVDVEAMGMEGKGGSM